MPTVERQALVPYTPEQMFALVNSVQEYPQFLPWCQATEILVADDLQMKAKVSVAKGSMKQSFTTQNTLEKNTAIHMQLVDGPFKHLKGQWQFKPMGEGTQMSLYLDFDFSSKLLSLSFGPIFKQACETMLSAFTKRARVVYGQ